MTHSANLLGQLIRSRAPGVDLRTCGPADLQTCGPADLQTWDIDGLYAETFEEDRDCDWRNKRFRTEDNARFAVNIVVYCMTS